MIEITMDLTTSLTILSGLATVLGFFWTIFHNRKKPDDDIDECAEAAKDNENEMNKVRERIDDLEKSMRDQTVEIEKLSELSSISKEESARLRQDFLDNLDRIEARLEKMIDLILRFKRDE